MSVHKRTRDWFERDVNLRAHLAVSGARRALVSRWQPERWSELRDLLVEVSHDERVMGAAACDSELKLLARTPDFPDEFSCARIGEKVRPAAGVLTGRLTDHVSVAANGTP